MLNFTYGASRSFQNLWGKGTERPTEKLIYQLDQLEVKVDLDPIGGYRGKVGTLMISHVEHKVFTDWNQNDLQALAQLERRILHIQERAGVSNTLIFGRQEGHEKFKLSLVAYPKCNWIEKTQGLFHVIFGPPSLQDQEAKEIAQFYQSQFEEEFRDIAVCEGKEGADPFCQPTVIENQKIVGLSFNDESYHILHDKCPKGRTAEDPHFLIIPEGDCGHCDGSQVPEQKRFHMLKIAQKAMQILLQEEKYSTLLLLERNGAKLQSVQHKHHHVIGIEDFPKSFREKILALLRQIYTPALSNLKDRIQYYQRQEWELKASVS